MFDPREFYRIENEKAAGAYENSLKRISEICVEAENDPSSEILRFFSKSGMLLTKLSELEKKLNDEYFDKPFEELKDENKSLFWELLPENYKTSYTNPQYCVRVFGDTLGQIMSSIYTDFRGCIDCCFKHKIFKFERVNRLYIDIYEKIVKDKADFEELKGIIAQFEKDLTSINCRFRFLENTNKDYKFYNDISKLAEGKDLRYLFRFGEYVTDNEIETARFLFNYPKEKIDILSKSVVRAYINGFIRDNKDISKRKAVRIIYNLGMEIVINKLIECLETEGLNGFISAVESTEANKQYGYDHRFDDALHISRESLEYFESELENAASVNKSIVSDYSGIIVFEKFGEVPFAPENKEECLKLSDEQTSLMQSHQVKLNEIFEKYMPETETSFCIIAFPIPEIGSNFKEIFEEVFEINMLDSKKYEIIQKSIIDALDRGSFVHVKGAGDNLTDIKVKLHELSNPEKQTNFENCVADVNIPVGEVFTSPVLKGTEGMLHLKEIFLDDLKYIDLKLYFKDGYISDYSCRNFENEADNRKYIEENLLFPHKTLPIGEFAIGTNTHAYAMAKKYNIVNLLPILIVEKMGPHFAIGDTCWSWAEDIPVFNPTDGKEIIARENEKSALRKTRIEEAYTNVHTDITLPYDELKFISVITDEGMNIEIIRDGRFVLTGAEELNEALPEVL